MQTETPDLKPGAIIGTAPEVRLEASGLAAQYGKQTIFSGVEFALTSGDCLVIVGPNGAGKSTLLRILAGLNRPARGLVTLTIGGSEPIRFGPQEGSPWLLAQQIGLASPELEVNLELTAAENLGFFSRVRGLDLSHSEIAESLAGIGLPGRGNDRVGAFSSGMRQRIRLLFAIQHKPEVLLLDEPGSNLDDAGRAVVEQLLRDHLTRGMAILATNDPDEVRLGQQILRLGGR